MNIPLREGISLNLSFLYLSDVLIILLVLILSLFIQKHIVRGLTFGALKG